MRIIIILTIIYLCSVSGEENVDKLWQQFKTTLNRNYTEEKNQERLQIFKKNLKIINTHNKRFRQGQETYEMGLTKFADKTLKEFLKYFPENSFMETYIINKNIYSNDTNDFLDWRTKGVVTDPKEQGDCGSCYIFSAVAALESYQAIKTKKLVSFSVQNILDCLPTIFNDYDDTSDEGTCGGGWHINVINYVKKQGINAEQNYPAYEQKQRECRQNKSLNVDIKFTKAVNVYGETEIKDALMQYGPLMMVIYVPSSWRFYKRGVWFDTECSTYVNHAVLLVGYGSENGRDYWLIKNWNGKHWGEDGYMKFARGVNDNYCGISFSANYIV